MEGRMEGRGEGRMEWREPRERGEWSGGEGRVERSSVERRVPRETTPPPKAQTPQGIHPNPYTPRHTP